MHDETALWDALAERLDALAAAWDAGGDPPDLAAYVPPADDPTRALALVELVKLDLERRAAAGVPQPLDAYLAAFPDLAPDGQVPAELVYEDVHQRRQHGEEIGTDEVLEAHPEQATALERLLALEGPGRTTALHVQTPKHLPAVGTVIDDFLLVDQLGRGAFAAVYLARQQSMHRTVALKVSADRGDEARTLAQLDHPHIVRVYDQRRAQEDGLRLLYMEYVEAGTLEEVVARARSVPEAERSGKLLLQLIDETLAARGRRPPADSLLRARLAEATWAEAVCTLGAQLARALAYAHDRGVLHRDVKPANVLLGGDGRAKLADFNISYSSKLEGASAAAYLGGSLAYMAPEQLEACSPHHERSPESLDGRADLFALGVVLYELLTGTRPFDDSQRGDRWTSFLDGMIQRRHGGLSEEAAQRLPAEMPLGLVRVLQTLLASNPRDRFPDATTAAQRLELCLDPEAARLLLPTRRGPIAFLRRHPIVCMLSAVLVPNAILAALNIAYNQQRLVEQTGAESLVGRVTLVNAVAFSIGIALGVYWAWAPARRTRARMRGVTFPPDVRLATRKSWLALGRKLAYMAIPLWVVGGATFPIWHHLETGVANGGAYFHFTVSNILFGALGATASFIVPTLMATRGLAPAFVEPGDGDASEVAGLGRFAKQPLIWLGVFTAVPFVSVILLSFFPAELTPTMIEAADGTAKPAASAAGPFRVLGIIGVLGFLLVYGATLMIRRDLAALGRVLDDRDR